MITPAGACPEPDGRGQLVEVRHPADEGEPDHVRVGEHEVQGPLVEGVRQGSPVSVSGKLTPFSARSQAPPSGAPTTSTSRPPGTWRRARVRNLPSSRGMASPSRTFARTSG